MQGSSLLFCYCGHAYPSDQLPEHFSTCPSRLQNSLIASTVYSLSSQAQDVRQLTFLLEEIKVELRQLGYDPDPNPSRGFGRSATGEFSAPPFVRPPERAFSSGGVPPSNVSQIPAPKRPESMFQQASQVSQSKPGYPQPAPEKMGPQRVDPVRQPAQRFSVPAANVHSSDDVTCVICGNGLSISSACIPDCGHFQCPAHPSKAFDAQFATQGIVKCQFPGCDISFSHAELRKIVGCEKFEQANTRLNNAVFGTDIVECSKCKTQFAFEEGDPESNKCDAEGNKLSATAASHRAKFRYRCPICTNIGCRSCNAVPYHDGRTCEEQKIFLASKKCRYCDTVVGAAAEICDNEECKKRYQKSCKKILPCSHRCYGTVQDEECPPCLNEKCGNDPNEGEYCNICFTEGLGSQPVVVLECGHYLHANCLGESLAKRWTGPRITFAFARCPLCKAWALPKNHRDLRESVERYKTLYADILARALEQLRLEKEHADPRLTDPTNKDYYQQPEKYVMDRFCFFECFECKKWYYGGKKDCGQNIDGKFEPTDLVCPPCSSKKLGGQGTCPTHGADYIQFKCRFCCGVAAWFCWGTTHFCNDCHAKQNNKIYLNKMPKDQLPKCPGVAECPLHVEHPPNGDEYPLGCELCRQALS